MIRKYKTFSFMILCIFISAFVVHYPVAVPDWGYEHFKIGSRAHRGGMMDIAESEYALAIKHRPVLQAINNLALLKEQQGKTLQAVQYWKMLQRNAVKMGNERLMLRAQERIQYLEERQK